MKFIKHVALLFLYFVAYQIASGFLMVGPTLQSIQDIPTQLIDSTIWICAIIGLVLSIALIILLWKYIYPRHSVDYRVTASWFHKIQWPILLYIAFLSSNLLYQSQKVKIKSL